MEFPGQEEQKEDDNQAHEDEIKRRRTRSEVWGTEPSRKSKRLREQSTNDQVLIMKVIDNENSLEIKIPRTYSEAVNLPEGKSWKDAMDYEIFKPEEMNTWSEFNEADVPQSGQILPGMWVNTVKNLESGERKFRSRWVVWGDQQKGNLSLNDTFSPVS